MTYFSKCFGCFVAVASVVCLVAAVESRTAIYQNALCQSNLREIGLAIRQYAEDHDGRFPDACDRSVRPWRWWDQDLFAYTPDLRVFYCPSHTPKYFPVLKNSEPITLTRHSQNTVHGVPMDVRNEVLLLADTEKMQTLGIPLADLNRAEAFHLSERARGERSPLLPVLWDRRDIGYGMNYYFASAQMEITHYSLKRLKNPEKLVLVADAQTSLLRPTKAMWKSDTAPRHDGYANFLFADGHIESLDPQPENYSKPDSAGILNPSHWRPVFE